MKKLTLLAGMIALSTSAMAQNNPQLDNSGTVVDSKNPFVKPVKVIPNNLPKGLPNDYNNVNFIPNMPNNILQNENSQLRFEWYHMRVVGFINDNVLIRMEDPNNNNNNNNSNGGTNSNNNNNNSNNTQPTITLLVTLNERFFFNKQFFVMKKEKNFFTIYNKSNQAVHSMVLESQPAQIIPKLSSSASSTSSTNNQGAASATR
jgi:hypothetical protein